MKRIIQYFFALIVLSGVGVLFAAFSIHQPSSQLNMPWKAAGLTQQQAAAHLIDRFTFGNKPGLLDAVIKQGLENWFLQQIEGIPENENLLAQLKEYDALQLTNSQVLTVFPRNGAVLKQAIEDGAISKDSVALLGKGAYKEILKAYMDKKGYRPQNELYRQFANQKILTAAYSHNQLQQVLTEFWFNHFNVSATKNECAAFVPAYERDVIRPNVTGKFGDLLLATAQSPAMLFYLDNFNSSGKNAETEEQDNKRKLRLQRQANLAMSGSGEERAKALEQLQKKRKEQGLNENYAREIMELHTMGVDGGYTQTDVTEAARVLTGWTVFPMNGAGGASGSIKKLIDKVGESNLEKRGFVHKGDFFFAINRHDDKEKTVLGKTFAAGGGYQEGVDLINMLALHPSTAQFISKKLATRFVSDNPPQSLIDKMAVTFSNSKGDIKALLITMVSAPEFWDKQAIREKTKSPLELTISAVRALDATVETPFMLYQWISKMGQRLYYYQAPTGFPDKGQYWINTGALLNRMKFGLAFAAQKIPGVAFNLAALNNNHEPESAAEALKIYSAIILPQRNLDATIKRLEPMIHDPAIQQKIDKAADKNNTAANAANLQNQETMQDEEDIFNNKKMSESKLAKNLMKKKNSKELATPMVAGNNSMLAQVVGIILGSPEFQRR